jgi:hypothetical protein
MKYEGNPESDNKKLHSSHAYLCKIQSKKRTCGKVNDPACSLMMLSHAAEEWLSRHPHHDRRDHHDHHDGHHGRRISHTLP